MYPWLDRSGRLSWLKLLVFIGLLAPGTWAAVNLALGTLGPRPIMEAIHEVGLWAIRFLFVALAVTPLRQLLQWTPLVQLRRQIGVASFCYAFSHIILYTVDQSFDLWKVASEIVLRIYLTIGFIALLGLTALAITSTDGMIRRLGGKRWRRLHQTVYGIGVLACIHYFLQSKADVGEATVMCGLYAWLMSYRVLMDWVIPKGKMMPIWIVALLGVGSGFATMLGEAGYFWFKRGIDPLRVLNANLSLNIGMRPGLAVLAITLGLTLAVLVRMLAKSAARARPRLASAGE